MKNNYYIFLLFITITFLTTSCGKTLTNETPEEFAKSILYTLETGDTTSLWKILFTQPSDSINTKNDLFRSSIHNNLGSEKSFSKFIDNKKDDFNNFLLESKKIGIDWKSATFKNVSYSESYNEKFGNYSFNDFYVYFDVNGKEFRFEITDSYKSDNNKIKDFELQKLINIQDEEDRLKNEDYAPSDVYISNQYNWKYKYSDLKRFTEFYIDIVNHSNEDITNVKYNIKISTQTGWPSNEVFNKTYEYNQKIYKDNKIRIEVADLKDFYVGVDVSGENSFSMKGEIIDVKPHPQLPR